MSREQVLRDRLKVALDELERLRADNVNLEDKVEVQRYEVERLTLALEHANLGQHHEYLKARIVELENEREVGYKPWVRGIEVRAQKAEAELERLLQVLNDEGRQDIIERAKDRKVAQA